MLTRLKVEGFKNLVQFDAHFGPFTCIAGENGVGKSNIFDAIQFLSLIADKSLAEAAQEVRSSRQDRVGQPEHLFTIGGESRRMKFAVEMVVPRSVEDDFGAEVSPSISLLRYELAIGYESPTTRTRHGRLYVASEHLRHINRGEAHKHLRFPLSVQEFRRAVVVGERRGGPFISTDQPSGRITVHQDGGSRGRPRRALPPRPATTVVSTVNSADDPTILAVRREMQSWRRLALEPSALRAADQYNEPDSMQSDGRHVAAALYRIANSDPNENPDDVYARIAGQLSALAGLDIRDIRVESDDVRELFTIMTTDGEGRELPARSLSEGTLRYLALCVLLEDPEMTGLITMEEPENGIHPANLPQVVTLIRDLAVDTSRAPGPENPLRQVIVNTHSPAVVQLVGAEDLLVARENPFTIGDRRLRSLTVEGFAGTWRVNGAGSGITRADLLPYLVEPPGAQLVLFDEVA